MRTPMTVVRFDWSAAVRRVQGVAHAVAEIPGGLLAKPGIFTRNYNCFINVAPYGSGVASQYSRLRKSRSRGRHRQRAIDASPAGFPLAMNVSCRPFIRMIRRAEPPMPDGGGCLTGLGRHPRRDALGVHHVDGGFAITG